MNIEEVRHVAPAALHGIAARIIRAAGSAEAEAETVSAHLVGANLTGHDSHGVGMLPGYLEVIADGRLVPNTPARLVEDGGAYLRFAGDRGYGQRVGREAMELAIERARRTGLCAIALAGSGHLGRIGTYAEQAVDAGLASIHFVNTVDHEPVVAPFGGTDGRFGTNPVCIAFPGGDQRPPTVFDMATSAIAFGKVWVAQRHGRPLPERAVIDAEGNPTTDPGVMFAEPRGALLPVGGHKGYGLSFACELLAGVLTGGGTIQPGNERRDSIVNHMFAVVVDPARFGDPAWMRREVDALVGHALASPARPGDDPVMQPGEPERRYRQQRQASGIPLDATTWDELAAAAASVGVELEL